MRTVETGNPTRSLVRRILQVGARPNNPRWSLTHEWSWSLSGYQRSFGENPFAKSGTWSEHVNELVPWLKQTVQGDHGNHAPEDLRMPTLRVFTYMNTYQKVYGVGGE